MWFFTSTLIWYHTNTHTHTHTHTDRHTAQTGTDRLTHPLKYTLTPPAIYINTNITVTLTGVKFTEVWHM